MSLETQFDVMVDSNREKEGEKYKIGVAYGNVRGSITIYLNALPLRNEIFLIPVKGR